jgi:glycosyltransferase involved in cell wall biosynthesis
MRILFDGSLLRRTHTGLATLIRGYLSQAALDPEIELHLLNPDTVAETDGEITYHSASLTSETHRLKAQHVLLPRLERALRPDVTVLFNPYVPALGSSSLNRIVFLADMRHLRSPQQFSKFQRAYRRATWPAGVRRSAHLIGISRFALEEAHTFMPFDRAKSSVIHCGSDHVDSWIERNAVPSAPYTLHFAQRSNKGTPAVLSAWQIYRRNHPDSPLRLRIIGLSEQQLAELPSDPTVIGSSSLEPSEFATTFAQASCLIFVSDYEGFGLPIVEAARLSIPVIASPVPAVTEGCVRAAHVLPLPASPGGLAEAIHDTFTNQVVQGREARTSVDDLTWSRAYRSFRAIAESVS